MQYRKFGSTNLEVSEIGFGAWAIGGGAMVGDTAIGWGDANDQESVAALHAALDAGINFFDTADIYGLGHSETLIGKTISNEKSAIIASKVGNVARDGQFSVDYDPAYITEACEQSLRRLNRDYIDYYQLHTARMTHLQSGACMEAMNVLQQQGKIRYWGLSLNTFAPQPEAEYLMEQKEGKGFQLVLNLINQRALGITRLAGKNGYGVIARMPLQFGLLTGKFDEGVDFPDNDHRKGRLTASLVNHSAEALAPVWELCKQYNCSKTALALSYILSYPEVSTVIPGIRTKAQVQLNTKGLFKLNDADRQIIEDRFTTHLAAITDEMQQLG